MRFTRLDSGKMQADCYYMGQDGSITRVRRTGRSKAEARRRIEAELQKTDNDEVDNWGALLSLWLRRHQGVQQTTREGYQNVINWYLEPKIGKIRLTALTAKRVDGVINEIYTEVSRDAAKKSLGKLKQAARWAVRVGLLTTDPTASAELPGDTFRRRPTAPPDERVDLLIRLLAEDLESTRSGPKSPNGYMAALVMKATGARIGECCSLEWPHVDAQRNCVTFFDTAVFEGGTLVSRGHLKNQDPRRTVFAPHWLFDDLSPYTRSEGYVLSTRTGGMVSPTNIRRKWRTVYNRAGVDPALRVEPHDLRRAVGTKIAHRLGVDAAARQLGNTIDVVERHYVEPSFTGPEESATVL